MRSSHLTKDGAIMSVFSEDTMIKWTPLKVGKWLRCGCCGTDFTVWIGYQDQDQDNGYGICKSCQKYDEKRNDQEYDKCIALSHNGLKEGNRAKFDGYDRDLQIALVNKAINDGVITWEIK